MNATEKKCIMAEQVCEVLIGGAAGIVVSNYIFPKCNKSEKVIVTLGSMVTGWAAGRAFAKTFYKFCDVKFGTDFKEIYDKL